jgi:hypothetical protein
MSLNTILATAPLTTQNFVLKANGTTIGNSLIFDNGTNVGIGNTNTSYTLDVSGSGNFSGILTTGSNVGIGVTPSAWYNLAAYVALQVGNASLFGRNSANSELYLSSNVFDNSSGAATYITTDFASRYIQNDGTHTWLTAPSGTAGTAVTFTPRMTILQAGNVGIGTSSPSGQFQVQATNSGIVFDTATAYTPRIKAAGALSDLQIESVGNGGHLYLSAPGTTSIMTMSTNGAERMRILSSTPTVVIGGTTGAYTSTNRGNLTLSGSASSLLGFHNGTIQTGYIYNDYSANLFQWYSVSNPIEITSTSLGVRLNANATSWSPISSDERTKKNFETTQGLNEVLQIEPVKYHFIEEDDNKIKRLGFKAQNLKPLIPEMVYSTDKKMEDGSDILTITPDYLLPVLVKAIQELSKQNEELSNRLIKLENK